ncbi:hypothetical protein LL033_14675 [Clostridium estertheticum]|uniref:hypothetical protein n=1 Tax=Clostridium estertheticum TaxID=238834 RepID=UPI001C0D64EE|nr:hypothetical protein [Clostridium estertheticum]MBU3218205.1 hypothetical protein [Clostridium estertheticum]WAG53891.1 hypothetical protein LL033_14675 [Clostridium estertheticum]
MAIISYGLGHKAGDYVGTSGYLNEQKVIREYEPVCIAELEHHGHTLINCTPSNIITIHMK